MFVCSLMAMYKPMLAINCRLQIEQVNSDCAESDDGPLALAFLSSRFLSASQILFASNWEAPLLIRQRHCLCSILSSLFPGLSWDIEILKRGFKGVFVAFLLATL